MIERKLLCLDGSGVYGAVLLAYNVTMRGRFTIGDVIRKARKERGWGQERLGEEALKFRILGSEKKVNKATISKIEGSNPYTSEFGVIWRVLAAVNLTFADIERLTGRPFIEDHSEPPKANPTRHAPRLEPAASRQEQGRRRA